MNYRTVGARLQIILLIVLFVMQIFTLNTRPEIIEKNTTVYKTAAPGASAYDVWISQGNKGTRQDYLTSLKGSNGTNGTNAVAYAVPANNGLNGLNGTNAESPKPCTTYQDEEGTIISCPDGSKTIIPRQEVTNGTVLFQTDPITCDVTYKTEGNKYWSRLVRDPDCEVSL